MSDNKKYYYMRLKENFFDSSEMKILEGMNDGYLYSNILLKMYLMSLKTDGKLILNDTIPYNENMIAAVTGHPVGVVHLALDTFQSLGLIEILDDGAIYMLSIQNFIGASSTEADRIREFRSKISKERTNAQRLNGKRTPEIEIEQELELDLKLKLEQDTHTEDSKGESVAAKRQRVDYKKIADLYNTICIDLPQVIQINDTRKKKIATRLKSYSIDDLQTAFEKAQASDFMTGRVGDWKASFDWIIKSDENMAKILEGNYDNKARPSADESRQAANNYWANL